MTLKELNKGYPEHGNSSTAPQVRAFSRGSLDVDLKKITNIFCTTKVVLPVQNLRKFTQFLCSGVVCTQELVIF